MEKGYRFLAVAPSAGIGRVIEETAASKKGIQVTVRVGSLQQGVEIVQAVADTDYDAIVARGATARMIKEVSRLPVIEIRISFYDILQAVKLAENFREPFAIVGFPSVADNAARLKELLRTEWNIYTLQTAEEADAVLPMLRQKGIRLVVSGMALDSYFQKYQFRYVRITTGRSSIEDALEEACQISDVFRPLRRERDLYRRLWVEGEDALAVFDTDHTLLFSTLTGEDALYGLGCARRMLKTGRAAPQEIRRIHENVSWRIRWRPVTEDGTQYQTFYFSRRDLPRPLSKNGVEIYTKADAAKKYLSDHPEPLARWREKGIRLEQLSIENRPLLLIGEKGTGKSQLAAWLYTREETERQFYIVDLTKASDRQWHTLMESEESPLNLPGWVFYCKQIRTLSPTKLHALQEMVENTVPYTKNQYIFTADAATPAIMRFADALACQVIHTLPLRERKEELMTLANICINTCNIQFVRQVSGFDAEAQLWLLQYDWPGNLPQFRRILTQLVQNSSGPYIEAENLRSLLEMERQTAPAPQELSLRGKTLEEINAEAARRALEDCGGNQTQAAKQLGICRTTLWRMLGKHQKAKER